MPSAGAMVSMPGAARAGFRSDYQQSSDTALMLSGESYYVNEEISGRLPTTTPPLSRVVSEDAYSNGGNLIARLQHSFSSDSKLELQTFADLTNRDDIFLDSTRRTIDVELQHRLKTSPHNEFSWGGSFRNSDNDLVGQSRAIRVADPAQRISLATAFIQDEFALVPNTLIATLGTKLEHQDLTGLELQPSARLRWVPTKHETLWVAVSRATNTPAIVDDDLTVEINSFVSADGTPVLTTLLNNHDKPSENLTAFEVGYRRELAPTVSVDLASFANFYDGYITTEPLSQRLVTDDGSPYILNEVIARDFGRARSYGGEVSLEWHPEKTLRLSSSYSYISIEKSERPVSQDIIGDLIEGATPKNIVQFRSLWNITPTVQLDSVLHYVDDRPTLGVEGCLDGDLRVGWNFAPGADLSLVGQNLFESYHQENVSTGVAIIPAEAVRAGFLKLTVEF